MQLEKEMINKFNSIPDFVKKVGNKLLENNFEAFLVGGCVRDMLLSKTPKDYDIATNATPEEISHIFPRSILIGARFGTVTVLSEENSEETFPVEVTTYRSEAEYINGRWPSKVEFSKTIQEDLARRDFTINALALNMDSDKEELIDLHGGLQDLNQRIIRAVGNPIERFSEDGLRPYRACRFASTLKFEIDENTFEAIKETLNVAKLVSPERVRVEFVRMILESSHPSKGIDLMRECGLLNLFLPELLEGYGVIQNDFHTDDVYWHNLHCVDIAPDEVKLAALFHDIGKPRKKDGPHFYGHDLEGAEMTRKIMKRLRFSNEEIQKTSNLIRWHMFYYPITEATNDQQKLEVRNEMMKHGWSDQAVRRFIRNVGGTDQIDQLFKLRIADATCNPKSAWDPIEIQALEMRVSKVLEQDMAMKITDLDITGTDLINLGVPKGPEIKKILNYLLDKVEEDPNLNERTKLLELSRNMI